MQQSTIKKIFLVVVSFVVMLAGSFFWIFYGAPIHDFRLWLLEGQFTHANIQHPVESDLLGRKSYLGGPSTHGSGMCVYAVGEVRRTELNKDQILNAYQDARVEELPLKIYFTDESELPYEVPFDDWQNELGITLYTEKDVYIVYVVTKHHFLGDLRCDD